MKKEYEAWESGGGFLFPQLAYVAYEKGCDGEDPCAHGATPEEAIANLKELLEDDVDWEYERREEARLDAMYDDRYSEES